ncbi:MAG: TetR/AcrR family transcriptional regulator [Syntrophomonas sp.]
MDGPTISLSTKDKIIKATLEIIAEQGFQNVTVRKIASRADVNIAAVNYHFGSKDIVIDKALKYVTNQMKSVFTVLKDGEQSPELRLQQFIRNYTEVISKYPDIIKYMIDQKIHNCDSEVEYSEYLQNEGIDQIKHTLAELRTSEDDSSLYMRTFQMLSCLSFPVLLGDQIQKWAGFDIYGGEMKGLYIDLLIRNIVGIPE